VKIGSGARVSGIFRIRTVPESQITLGDNFRADSISFDNPIGLSCPNQIQTFTNAACIQIGNDVGMSGVVISCTERIKIGNGVLLGANVRIFDSDFHPVNSQSRRYDRNNVCRAGIYIGDNCWIGAGSIILPGTHLKENVVVAANAVVKGEFGPNCIIAGVPAKTIKEL